MESKNNPFSSNIDSHYANHHGKKVEERVQAPEIPKPKYQVYMIKRIRDKCVNRGERGLFSLKRLFQTFDIDGNGTLEMKEFKRALKDFKLDLEDSDIENIFNSFDVNHDGVLQLNEFIDMILGRLEGARLQAVD